jgi:HK97 family phage major capsid protein
VGFWPEKTDKNAHGGQHVSAGDLVEISIVSAPAHPGATITSIKSANGRKDKHMAKAALKTKADEDVIDDAANDNGETTLESRVDNIDERLTALEETVNGTAATVESIDKSIKALNIKTGRPAIIRNVEKPEDIQRKAFVSYLRQGDRAPEAKSLIRSEDPRGGYMAPKEFTTELLREIVEFSPIRQYANVRSTGSPSVTFPARVGRTNAKWRGEQEQQEESTFGFAEIEIAVHELATFVDVSNELLADSVIDIEAEIRTAFAEDLSQKEGLAFVWGSGVKQPRGFMDRDDIAFSLNGHATELKADALIDLLYKVPQHQRNQGAWAMNGTTLATIRKLKDGQGNYLWQPAYTDGQPETILSRPVIEVLDMPDIASGAFPIAYADFSGYRIIDRQDTEVLVNPFARAGEGFTRFHLTKRLGADVAEPLKFRKLKMATS